MAKTAQLSQYVFRENFAYVFGTAMSYFIQ